MRNMTAGLFIKSFCFDMQKYLHISFTTDLSKKLLAYFKLSQKLLKWSFRNVYLGRDQKARIQTILFYKPNNKDNEKEKTSGQMGFMTAEKQSFLDSNCDLTSVMSSFAFVLLLILTSKNMIQSTCPFFIAGSCNVHMFIHLVIS